MIGFLRCAGLSATLAACVPSVKPGPAPPEPSPTPAAPVIPTSPVEAPPAAEQPPADAAAESPRVLSLEPKELVNPLQQIMSTRDVEALSLYAHPERGMRFSPDPSIHAEDIVLTAEELRDGMNSGEKREFGKGTPHARSIQLSILDYFDTYVAVGDVQKVSVDAPDPGVAKLFPKARVLTFHGTRGTTRFVLQGDGETLWIVAILRGS